MERWRRRTADSEAGSACVPARRLNVPIDRPSITEAYWPFDRVAEGDRLHAWVDAGNAFYRYPHFPEEAA